MKHIRCLLITLCLTLTGCATTGAGYNEPTGQAYATIRGQESGFSNQQLISVYKIDHKDVGMLWSGNSKVKVAPGYHTINVVVDFRQVGFLNVVSQAVDIRLHFHAVAGRNYAVKAKVQGKRIITWVADSHGRRVSTPVSKPYQDENIKDVSVPEMAR